MKTLINLSTFLLVAFSALTSLGQPASITNFTKSVHYVPPVDFKLEDYFRDSGDKNWPDDLFKYCGSGVQYDKTNGDDTILFMLQPAFYAVSHTNPLLPRTPENLKDDLLRPGSANGQMASTTNFPDVQIGKIAGYTSVSTSTFFASNSSYHYLCWIQIQSNIVVAVTITSPSKKSFDAATNSLRTLKIDKKEIMNVVKSSAF